jgi:hypothetical protein
MTLMSFASRRRPGKYATVLAAAGLSVGMMLATSPAAGAATKPPRPSGPLAQTRTLSRPSSSAPAWSIVPTPNPSGATDSNLDGVSCTSASACIAVGQSFNGTTDEMLAEHWNGTTWAITPTPSPSGTLGSGLRGVSCTSASACTAVGFYSNATTSLPLAERWNGTTWAIQKMRNPSGGLINYVYGVSCTSVSACTAVGSTNVGSTDNVGTYTLAEHWNGKVWAIQKAAKLSVGEGYLDGVSCTSASACTAVGTYTKDGEETLAEQWNGKVWAIQPTLGPPDNSVLQAVSCTSASACTAVGSYHGEKSGASEGLVQRWNGTKWASQPFRHAKNATVTGVSCTSASACIAVGGILGAGGGLLAESWNGTTWTIQTTPNPAGEGGGVDSVSCTSASACTDVGGYVNSAGITLTLAERYGPSSGVSTRRRVA